MAKQMPPALTVFAYPDGLRVHVKTGSGAEFVTFIPVETNYQEPTRLCLEHMSASDEVTAPESASEAGKIGGEGSET